MAALHRRQEGECVSSGVENPAEDDASTRDDGLDCATRREEQVGVLRWRGRLLVPERRVVLLVPDLVLRDGKRRQLRMRGPERPAGAVARRKRRGVGRKRRRVRWRTELRAVAAGPRRGVIENREPPQPVLCEGRGDGIKRSPDIRVRPAGRGHGFGSWPGRVRAVLGRSALGERVELRRVARNRARRTEGFPCGAPGRRRGRRRSDRHAGTRASQRQDQDRGERDPAASAAEIEVSSRVCHHHTDSARARSGRSSTDIHQQMSRFPGPSPADAGRAGPGPEQERYALGAFTARDRGRGTRSSRR